MTCPKCGAEMAEGHLYCEKCGAEVQIVPVFEPELEESIRDTMRVMAEDVAAVGTFAGKGAKEDGGGPGASLNGAGDAESRERGRQRQAAQTMENETAAKPAGALNNFLSGYKKKTGLTCIFLLLLLGVTIGASYRRNHSYEYQLSRALQYIEDGQYEKAAPVLEKAVRLEPDATEARLLLADVYSHMNNSDGAVLLLNEVVGLDPGNEQAYSQMVSIYEEQGRYEELDRLLKKCENDKIKRQFSSYMALAPKFSQDEGTYNEKISLRVMADTEGEIYYNLSGRPASTESLKYKGPLELGEGTHVVSAIFVNAYGVVSDSVTATYEIELITPEKPEVTPAGGIYDRPNYIRAEIPEDCEVYYTSDGSIPTKESKLYEAPLAMPLGDSLFTFIAISEFDKAGDVTEVKYTLTMNKQVTPQAAELAIKTKMITKGRIIDYEGHTPDLRAVYSYRCGSAVAEGARDYYIVEELRGNRPTGNIYAVDADTGDLYEAVYNSVGKFEFKYFF